MNRAQLTERVAEQVEEPLGIVEQIIDVALEVIMAEIRQGQRVTLEGFGNFFLRHAAGKTEPHPHTGEPVEHPSYRQIAFKATGALRSAVNGGRAEPAPELRWRFSGESPSRSC